MNMTPQGAGLCQEAVAAANEPHGEPAYAKKRLRRQTNVAGSLYTLISCLTKQMNSVGWL
jgi:hypothetical protein